MQIIEPIFNKYRGKQILDEMRRAHNSEFTWLRTDSFISLAHVN